MPAKCPKQDIPTQETNNKGQNRKQKIEALKNQQTKALIALFPELQQQESQNREASQNTGAQNRSARTDIGTGHRPTQDHQMPEPTQQNWPIQETVIDVESTYRKQTNAPIALFPEL